MTPQSNFMIVAPIAEGRESDLRRLLASMTREEGIADPENAIVPFGRLGRLHFARIVILDDLTLDDITVHGLPRVDYPLSLAFLGDVDGPRETFLDELIDVAGPGLVQIFSHCEGAPPPDGLRRFLDAHAHAPSASYVNWIGRTVRQVREDAALRDALARRLAAIGHVTAPREIHADLRRFAEEERRAGRLTLTPDAPTPLGWQIMNALHLVFVPLLLLVLAPLVLVFLPFYAIALRAKERRDPEVVPRIDPAHAHRLALREDRDVTNQFSAMGTLKPGLLRRWTAVVLLWLIDWTTRHVFNRGRLARVSTIHFARWVFIDGGRRMVFASNYDGSLDSYMDDFINKVAFGLNLVFSNGVGYPATRWLIVGGAKDEQKFKYYIRRHQMPTEVWYNAHPGLTALDLARNARLRDGLFDAAPSDGALRDWLRLLPLPAGAA